MSTSPEGCFETISGKVRLTFSVSEGMKVIEFLAPVETQRSRSRSGVVKNEVE